ncbi:MAG: hypothetical protein M3O36_16000 [Myxococcota bacterium]|nr:hypothetical protein [Myxococcota bacterium]
MGAGLHVTQLANYAPGGAFPFIRETQLQSTETVFGTGLRVTIDIGNPTYIHPGDKHDVGLRLGLAARALTYGQAVPYSGPIYESHDDRGQLPSDSSSSTPRRD